MKKASLVIITLTLICCGFAIGFFLGRGSGTGSIRVSAVPPPSTEPSQPSTDGTTEPSIPLLVDINSATAEELTALPGIGSTLARRIVSYREANGPFESFAELLNVEGIGEKKLEDILDYITIGGQP